MTTALSDSLLSCLSQFVVAKMGLQFPRERWADLERGVHAVAHECGFEDPESCVRWLLSSSSTQHQVEVLAGYLTVGETYFFRERRSFEVLEQQILPEAVASRGGVEQRLRLWSAACCTGEEPYSMAIAIRRAIPALTRWPVTLLATDINWRFLRRAATGVYGQWSFRDAPGWLKEQYFTVTLDGRFRIVEAIQSMVTFAYLNLAADAYPSLLNDTNAMDVIFCRNVLMYFSPQRATRVIQNLSRCLVEGGWLVVSPSELSQVRIPDLTAVDFPGVSVYRKSSRRGQPVAMSGFWREEEAASLFEPEIELTPAPTSQPVPLPPNSELVVRETDVLPAILEAGALFSEAMSSHERGRYEETVARLHPLLSLEPGFLPAMTLMARTLANQGQLSGALEWCDRAISADKLCSTAHYLRATILQEQGAIDQASAALRLVLYLDPDFVLAHFALGTLALHKAKPEVADRHFANALRLLEQLAPGDVLPESDGVTAGRLAEIIAATRELEVMP